MGCPQLPAWNQARLLASHSALRRRVLCSFHAPVLPRPSARAGNRRATGLWRAPQEERPEGGEGQQAEQAAADDPGAAVAVGAALLVRLLVPAWVVNATSLSISGALLPPATTSHAAGPSARSAALSCRWCVTKRLTRGLPARLSVDYCGWTAHAVPVLPPGRCRGAGLGACVV